MLGTAGTNRHHATPQPPTQPNPTQPNPPQPTPTQPRAGGVGRDYLLTQITINGTGPYDFMVDSGLTAELITPHLQQTLGIQGRGTKVAGLVSWGLVGLLGMAATSPETKAPAPCASPIWCYHGSFSLCKEHCRSSRQLRACRPRCQAAPAGYPSPGAISFHAQGAGGAVAGGELVPLTGAALCCGDFPFTGGKELPLPPLNAVVTPFPQEHLVRMAGREGLRSNPLAARNNLT
jgi:hypothetical protein